MAPNEGCCANGSCSAADPTALSFGEPLTLQCIRIAGHPRSGAIGDESVAPENQMDVVALVREGDALPAPRVHGERELAPTTPAASRAVGVDADPETCVALTCARCAAPNNKKLVHSCGKNKAAKGVRGLHATAAAGRSRRALSGPALHGSSSNAPINSLQSITSGLHGDPREAEASPSSAVVQNTDTGGGSFTEDDASGAATSSSGLTLTQNAARDSFTRSSKMAMSDLSRLLSLYEPG